MAVAQDLGLSVPIAHDPTGTGADDEPTVYQPVSEMELARVLEAVFDSRKREVTTRLEAMRAQLQEEIEGLEVLRDELRAGNRAIGQLGQLTALWDRVLPQLKDTKWYSAAEAVGELDRLINDI